MAGKEEGGWDGLLLMSSSWKVLKPQNLRAAWVQVGPLPGWGPIINAVLMGCLCVSKDP